MRIGIDATCWMNRRGYGRFTRELLPAMAALAPDDTLICFVTQEEVAAFDLAHPNVETRAVALSVSPTAAASARGHRAVGDMLKLTRTVGRQNLDVFFSPSVYTYFPLPPGLRAVVTVHDAIADRFPDLTLPSWRARAFWRLKVTLALWQARIILTVSDFAASEIVSVLGVRPERIRVALEAPAATYREPTGPQDAEQAAQRLGFPRGSRWFAYVGGFNPHKNVDLLVRAHAALARELGPRVPHLVLVGPTTGDVYYGDLPRIRRTIEREGTSALVHWLDFVPDVELRQVHAGALALVLPSTCEGFGLPAVEAAGCGAPVIATTQSPLPRLLGGGGLFVPPGDLDRLVDALRFVATDEPTRQHMGRCARHRALQLTWERTASTVLDALREATAS
jgi:glycosyltransferase involved in cell wall biosynthesis